MASDQIVYFLENRTTGLIKIGVTKNFPNRLSAIRSKFRGDEIIPIGYLKNGRTVEKLLHFMFSDSREFGEWFEPVDGIRQFIESSCRSDFASIIIAPSSETCAYEEMNPRPESIELFSPADAAIELDLSRQHVQRLCEGGEIPAQKIGRMWVISREQLEWYRAKPKNGRGKYSRKPKKSG